MRRLAITTAVILSLSATTSISFAGKWNNNGNGGQKKAQIVQRFMPKAVNQAQLLSQPSSLSGGSNSGNSVKKYKRHNKQDDNINNILPLDPGRGDGQVPTNSGPSMPTGKPGFVWVGDHWERAKAPTIGTSTPTGKPGFVWVGDHWERAKAPSTNTSTPTGKPGFVWVGDHWERAKAPMTSTSTPTGKPGFVWAGDHWERAKAPVNSTSKLMAPATISIIKSSEVSANSSFSPTRGANGRHREQFNANGTGNPGIPPAFLNMANTPPPAISKPTWNSGQLPPGVTVRPGSPNRSDVTGGGWEFPTITIKGELNPAYDSDRDHRTTKPPIPTYGSSLPWPFGP